MQSLMNNTENIDLLSLLVLYVFVLPGGGELPLMRGGGGVNFFHVVQIYTKCQNFTTLYFHILQHWWQRPLSISILVI